jgi:hypothetical protein
MAVISMGVAMLAVGTWVARVEVKTPEAIHQHTGTFVSATASTLVMTSHNGRQHSRAVAKTAAVMIDGKPSTLAALHKGTTISVTTDTSGTVTAVSTATAKPATMPTVKPTSSTVPVPPPKSAGK